MAKIIAHVVVVACGDGSIVATFIGRRAAV
jgi:hypothetical protein